MKKIKLLKVNMMICGLDKYRITSKEANEFVYQWQYSQLQLSC